MTPVRTTTVVIKRRIQHTTMQSNWNVYDICPAKVEAKKKKPHCCATVGFVGRVFWSAAACLNTSLMSSVSLLLHIHSGHAHAWKGERQQMSVAGCSDGWCVSTFLLWSFSHYVFKRVRHHPPSVGSHCICVRDQCSWRDAGSMYSFFIILSAPHSFIVVYSVSSLTIDLVFITFITQTLLSSYCKLLPKRPNYLSIYSSVNMHVRHSCVCISKV